MKQILIALVSVGILLFLIGAADAVNGRYVSNRVEGEPIVRYPTTQLTWDSGETDANTVSLQWFNGLLERIDVVASNSTNAITYTVGIANENSGTIVGDIAAIPENATTIKNALKATPDFEPIACADTLTITVTPSGDPGASGATIDVILFGK